MSIFNFFRGGKRIIDNITGRDVVIINGKIIVDGREVGNTEDALIIRVEGSIENLTTDMSVNCQDVTGNIIAKGSVNADAIKGNVEAGGSVNCDDVGGSVRAGGSVNCDSIGGSVIATTVIR